MLHLHLRYLRCSFLIFLGERQARSVLLTNNEAKRCGDFWCGVSNGCNAPEALLGEAWVSLFTSTQVGASVLDTLISEQQVIVLCI
jgi:hypothetical protein